MSKEVARLFGLKTMCSNCPWRNDGKDIPLSPGRLRQICDDLKADDTSPFFCHKTTGGGERIEDEDGEEVGYLPGGAERYCTGAMAYLRREGRPNLAMRLGAAFGDFKLEALDRVIPLVKAEEDIG